MLNVGKPAPDFDCQAIVDGKLAHLSLADLAGSYTRLFFYPLNFTFVCPTELHAFQDKLAEFKKRNVNVVGVSVDSAHSHLAWLRTPKNKGGIDGVTYPIISDINKTMCVDYGVLKEDEGIAFRGLFLLDKTNIVQHASVNNLPLGRNVYESLRLVDALQHHEKNGEVCPANWTAGDKAMTEDREGVLGYFK